MDGVTYRIKESSEDQFATVIEKTGGTVEFTPVDMLNEQHQLQKLIQELEAKVAHESAKQKNIEEHNPFVKDFTTQQLFTLHMYYESVALVEGIPPKLKEFREQLEESYEEYERISKELNLDIKPKEKEQIVDEAVKKIVE